MQQVNHNYNEFFGGLVYEFDDSILQKHSQNNQHQNFRVKTVGKIGFQSFSVHYAADDSHC